LGEGWEIEVTGKGGARPVGGRSRCRAIGYVQPGTASQILCQLLDKDGWERLLDGLVGRRPANSPHATCQIAVGQGLITIELRQSDDALDEETTIAGRPAAVDGDGFTVALTDDALRPAPRQYYPERRLLAVTVIADDPDTESEIAERVLEEIIPLVVAEGEPLPDIDDQGRVRYVSTPVTGEFVDLPTPVQALQLCTLMQEDRSFRVAVRDVEARDTGECRVKTEDDTFTVAANSVDEVDGNFPDRVAGRPARKSTDPPSVRVLLQDGAGVELWVTGSDSVELAEKLVPLLTG
jgi:hypothetical protein